MTRRSTFCVRSDPSDSNSRSWMHAQQLRLERRAHRADLVEEDRAAIGQRELAALAGRRAGERAAHVPEELRLEQGLRNRGAVHLDERHLALRAVIVDRARDHLLAGSGFPRDEDRALRSRDDFGRADDVLHPPAAAHEAVVIEVRVALADEISMLGAKPLMIERAADDDEELVDFERLLQVVERPELHGLDGALDRRVRGHHDDLRPLDRGRRVELADQIEAGDVRHQIVDDEQIEHALREEPLRLARARRGRDLVPFGAQRLRQRVENLALVVDEKNRACTHVVSAHGVVNP